MRSGVIATQTMWVLGSGAVNPKRPKVEPIRAPTLFQMDKFEEAGKSANTLAVDRPFSVPGILLGTSAFTTTGWEGSFYERGMQPRDFLSYYATQFATVEVDSTFYGCPSARTVNTYTEYDEMLQIATSATTAGA